MMGKANNAQADRMRVIHRVLNDAQQIARKQGYILEADYWRAYYLVLDWECECIEMTPEVKGYVVAVMEQTYNNMGVDLWGRVMRYIEEMACFSTAGS